jgi:hypothetical protein
LNNDIVAVEEFVVTKTGINPSDKGGRTTLFLAGSYGSPVIENLLSVTDVYANKPEVISKLSPLMYADRTRS